MKVLLIIFCIITITMLTALGITIIKSEDNSNKEKRYILLYIISFIVLMISSIISTLGNGIVSIILFIIFLVLSLIATKLYFNNQNKLNKNDKKLVPNKLKNNLKIIKEERDGYTYKVQTNFTCCNESSFKVNYIKEPKLNIIRCQCNKCKKEYELFNSELDGYKLEYNNDIKIIKSSYKDKRCSKCHDDNYNIEITYEYIDDLEEIKELKKTGISDFTNIYTSIRINLNCIKCNKKEKGFLKNESIKESRKTN